MDDEKRLPNNHFLPKEIVEQLLSNGRKQANVKGTKQEIDFKPVVKLFILGSQAKWLLTEIEPSNLDIAFGLCDLGMGFPELGYVSLSEFADVEKNLGVRIEYDRTFKADKTLSQYKDDARRNQGIGV